MDNIEHGITGDVLSVMEHASLTDLGMSSVGHRLNLLRAVWELKKEQGLELGEDDWRPQGRYSPCEGRHVWPLLTLNRSTRAASAKRSRTNRQAMGCDSRPALVSIPMRLCVVDTAGH